MITVYSLLGFVLLIGAVLWLLDRHDRRTHDQQEAAMRAEFAAVTRERDARERLDRLYPLMSTRRPIVLDDDPSRLDRLRKITRTDVS